MGRTGRLFAHEWAGVKPDVVSTAKGIGGGFPLGAILATEAVAKHLTAGSHGTTFGGSPLACAAGNAVLDVVLQPDFLDGVARTGEVLREALEALAEAQPDAFNGVRGRGLMLGIHCVLPNTALQAACMAEGLLVVAAGENVLRLVPPLVVSEEECRDAVQRLGRAAARVRQAEPAHAS